MHPFDVFAWNAQPEFSSTTDNCRLPILRHDCGFGSSQSLARAFRTNYHYSPSEFRTDNPYRVVSLTHRRETSRTNHKLIQKMRKSVRIIDQPRHRIAYVRQLGPYGVRNLMKFRLLKDWLSRHHHSVQDLPLYGIGWDNDFITPEPLCRYDIAVQAPDGSEPDDFVDIQTLPAGKYAVWRTALVRGMETKAWECFFQNWYPYNGYQLDLRPCFEQYLLNEGEGIRKDILMTDLFLPVRCNLKDPNILL